MPFFVKNGRDGTIGKILLEHHPIATLLLVKEVNLKLKALVYALYVRFSNNRLKIALTLPIMLCSTGMC